MRVRSVFFALMMALSAAAVKANDEPVMTVIPVKGSEVFKVIFKGTVSDDVRLTIYDREGRTIHAKRISVTEGFIYPVNFKDVEPGSYTIEVIDNGRRYEEQVIHGKDYEAKGIHVSKVNGADARFLVSVSNAQNEQITVAIIEDGQRVIHSETHTITGDRAMLYRVADEQAKVTFEISDGRGNLSYFTF